LPEKGRNDRLLKKLLKLLKRKLLGKGRLLNKLGKQINNERLRSRPLIMGRLGSSMRRRRRRRRKRRRRRRKRRRRRRRRR
jgi:hypothetical protein